MKHIDNRRPQIKPSFTKKVETKTINETNEINTINEKVMTTNEKIAMAKNVLNDVITVKRVKKDKGLIERTESSKTILTEDNKELLND